MKQSAIGRVDRRQKPPPPLDTGWAWMIVLGTFINTFFMVGIAKSFGLILIAFIEKFKATTATAALTMSTAAFVYALGAPAALIISEQLTSQRVVVFGAILGFIGISLSSLLFSMLYVIVVFGVSYGIGNSCLYGNGMVMVGKYFRKRISLAMGISLSGASIGLFAMPPLIEYFLDAYGLGGTLFLIGALYLNCAIAGCLFRPIEQYGPEAVEEVKEVVLEQGKDETEYLVQPDQTVVTQEILSDSTCKKNGTNHDLDSHLPNGDREGNTSLRFQDIGAEDSTTSFPNNFSNNNTAMGNNVRWSENLEEDSEDDFVERKAMFTSTGSVFFVSPSVHDVSLANELAYTAEVRQSPASFLKRMFDFSVLRSYVTMFFTVVSFLCFFGYFNFILFLPALFVEKEISKKDAAFLVSLCGLGDLIARITTGFFADLNYIARYKIKAMTCLLSSFNIFMFIYADTYAWLAVHTFFYGLLGGGYVCLMAVVLKDFVGLAKMASNLAVILLIQGMGAALGQPFLGWVKDYTGSFDNVTLLCSLAIGLGSIILFTYPLVRRLEESRLAGRP